MQLSFTNNLKESKDPLTARVNPILSFRKSQVKYSWFYLKIKSRKILRKNVSTRNAMILKTLQMFGLKLDTKFLNLVSTLCKSLKIINVHLPKRQAINNVKAESGRVRSVRASLWSKRKNFWFYTLYLKINYSCLFLTTR